MTVRWGISDHHQGFWMMKVQGVDAIGFYGELLRQNDIASCAALFKLTIAAYGFDVYACGAVDLDHRDLMVFFILEWPEDWRKFYLSSGLVERDPLIDALRQRRSAFTWSDLRRHGGLASLGTEALRRTADHGWTEGLAVPVPRGGSHFGLVSLAGRVPTLAAR